MATLRELLLQNLMLPVFKEVVESIPTPSNPIDQTLSENQTADIIQKIENFNYRIVEAVMDSTIETVEQFQNEYKHFLEDIGVKVNADFQAILLKVFDETDDETLRTDIIDAYKDRIKELYQEAEFFGFEPFKQDQLVKYIAAISNADWKKADLFWQLQRLSPELAGRILYRDLINTVNKQYSHLTNLRECLENNPSLTEDLLEISEIKGLNAQEILAILLDRKGTDPRFDKIVKPFNVGVGGNQDLIRELLAEELRNRLVLDHTKAHLPNFRTRLADPSSIEDWKRVDVSKTDEQIFDDLLNYCADQVNQHASNKSLHLELAAEKFRLDLIKNAVQAKLPELQNILEIHKEKVVKGLANYLKANPKATVFAVIEILQADGNPNNINKEWRAFFGFDASSEVIKELRADKLLRELILATDQSQALQSGLSAVAVADVSETILDQDPSEILKALKADGTAEGIEKAWRSAFGASDLPAEVKQALCDERQKDSLETYIPEQLTELRRFLSHPNKTDSNVDKAKAAAALTVATTDVELEAALKTVFSNSLPNNCDQSKSREIAVKQAIVYNLLINSAAVAAIPGLKADLENHFVTIANPLVLPVDPVLFKKQVDTLWASTTLGTISKQLEAFEIPASNIQNLASKIIVANVYQALLTAAKTEAHIQAFLNDPAIKQLIEAEIKKQAIANPKQDISSTWQTRINKLESKNKEDIKAAICDLVGIEAKSLDTDPNKALLEKHIQQLYSKQMGWRSEHFMTAFKQYAPYLHDWIRDNGLESEVQKYMGYKTPAECGRHVQLLCERLAVATVDIAKKILAANKWSFDKSEQINPYQIFDTNRDLEIDKQTAKLFIGDARLRSLIEKVPTLQTLLETAGLWKHVCENLGNCASAEESKNIINAVLNAIALLDSANLDVRDLFKALQTPCNEQRLVSLRDLNDVPHVIPNWVLADVQAVWNEIQDWKKSQIVDLKKVQETLLQVPVTQNGKTQLTTLSDKAEKEYKKDVDVSIKMHKIAEAHLEKINQGINIAEYRSLENMKMVFENQRERWLETKKELQQAFVLCEKAIAQLKATDPLIAQLKEQQEKLEIVVNGYADLILQMDKLLQRYVEKLAQVDVNKMFQVTKLNFRAVYAEDFDYVEESYERNVKVCRQNFQGETVNALRIESAAPVGGGSMGKNAESAITQKMVDLSFGKSVALGYRGEKTTDESAFVVFTHKKPHQFEMQLEALPKKPWLEFGSKDLDHPYYAALLRIAQDMINVSDTLHKQGKSSTITILSSNTEFNKDIYMMLQAMRYQRMAAHHHGHRSQGHIFNIDLHPTTKLKASAEILNKSAEALAKQLDKPTRHTHTAAAAMPSKAQKVYEKREEEINAAAIPTSGRRP